MKGSQTDWEALEKMKDEDIDLSEIPEVTAEQIAQATLRVGGKPVATNKAQVRTAYNSDPEREWRRLEGGAQARLEYLITMHALHLHLPPPDQPYRLFDAGGGPGRYTLALAAQGYAMTLLDLSPALLDLARQHIAAAAPALQQHIDAVHEGSITDLSRFPDQVFDGVLCLGGPLSHLLGPDDRQRALRELRRVARPGAPLFNFGHEPPRRLSLRGPVAGLF